MATTVLSKRERKQLLRLGISLLALAAASVAGYLGLEEGGGTVPPPSPTALAVMLPEGAYRVAGVVDGDTVKLELDGAVTTVRIIGINTPETVDPRKPVQCFGTEASARARELLEGAAVRLEVDPTQGTEDRYGRLLGYVALPDGSDYGLRMLEDGYAYEYTYGKPYQRMAAYRQAAAAAEAAGRGLWSPTTCAGDTAMP